MEVPPALMNYLVNRRRKDLVALEEKFNLRLVLEAREIPPGEEPRLELIKRQVDTEKTRAALQGLIEERLQDQKGLWHAE